MARNIFLNLPVKNLAKSIDFFKTLGFSFNPQFSDKAASCMIVSENIHVMLLTEEKFKEFTPKQICDTRQCVEVLISISCESRNEVDEIVKRALSAGGYTYDKPEDLGFMYSHSFVDLDGHGWGILFMDPSTATQQN